MRSYSSSSETFYLFSIRTPLTVYYINLMLLYRRTWRLLLLLLLLFNLMFCIRLHTTMLHYIWTVWTFPSWNIQVPVQTNLHWLLSLRSEVNWFEMITILIQWWHRFLDSRWLTMQWFMSPLLMFGCITLITNNVDIDTWFNLWLLVLKTSPFHLILLSLLF